MRALQGKADAPQEHAELVETSKQQGKPERAEALRVIGGDRPVPLPVEAGAVREMAKPGLADVPELADAPASPDEGDDVPQPREMDDVAPDGAKVEQLPLSHVLPGAWVGARGERRTENASVPPEAALAAVAAGQGQPWQGWRPDAGVAKAWAAPGMEMEHDVPRAGGNVPADMAEPGDGVEMRRPLAASVSTWQAGAAVPREGRSGQMMREDVREAVRENRPDGVREGRHAETRAEARKAMSPARGEFAGAREMPVQVVQATRQQFLPPTAMPMPVVSAGAAGGQGTWGAAAQQVLHALQGDGLAALLPGAGGPRATSKVVQRLEIQLQPASLGTVNARLSLSGGRLRIDIRVPDQRMVEHLRQGIEQLQRRIKAQDASVAQTAVRIIVDPSVAPPSQPSAMHGQGQGHAGGAGAMGAGAGQGMQEFTRQDGGGDARSPRGQGGSVEDATGGRGQDETPDAGAGAGAVYL